MTKTRTKSVETGKTYVVVKDDTRTVMEIVHLARIPEKDGTAAKGELEILDGTTLVQVSGVSPTMTPGRKVEDVPFLSSAYDAILAKSAKAPAKTSETPAA